MHWFIKAVQGSCSYSNMVAMSSAQLLQRPHSDVEDMLSRAQWCIGKPCAEAPVPPVPQADNGLIATRLAGTWNWVSKASGDGFLTFTRGFNFSNNHRRIVADINIILHRYNRIFWLLPTAPDNAPGQKADQNERKR